MDVIINHLSPNDTLDIIRDIREQGLVQGKDFDFAYYQKPEHTKFIFHEDKWATWFNLKYGHRV
jgi:hypothetical protein